MGVDVKKLRSEYTVDPEGIGYSGMTDQQATDSVNGLTRSLLGPLDITGVREWAAEEARGIHIQQGMTTGSTDQVKNLCYIADKILGSDQSKLDPANPLHVTMINELVANGVLIAGDKTALITKATKSISRGQEISVGGTVKLGHTQEARR